MKHHAFISYSHAADGKFAPALQNALQRIAKPIFKTRALNVFRDETSLSATPHLWATIEKALDNSEYLILLASPIAANSKWVQREVDYWLRNKSIDTILIGLTEGDILWNEVANDFDWGQTNSIPPNLKEKFSMEPLHIDFRGAKTSTDLSLTNPDFRHKAARFASTIHDKPLNDLIGEDVRLQKKIVRFRNSSIVILTILLLSTLLLAWLSENRRKIADGLRQEAENRLHAFQLQKAAEDIQDQNPQLALRLFELTAKYDPNEIVLASMKNLFINSDFSKNLPNERYREIKAATFSPDGQSFLTGETNSLCLWSLDGKQLQRFEAIEEKFLTSEQENFQQIKAGEKNTLPSLTFRNNEIMRFNGHEEEVWSAAFSPNSQYVLMGFDDNTARLWTLDGTMVQRFEGHEAEVLSVAFSPDGQYVLTSSRDKTARLWRVSPLSLEQFLQTDQIWALKDLLLIVNPNRKENKALLDIWDLLFQDPPMEQL